MQEDALYQVLQMMMQYRTLDSLPENWLQSFLHCSSLVYDNFVKEGQITAESLSALRLQVKKCYTSCVEMANVLIEAAGGQGQLKPLKLSAGDDHALREVAQLLSQKKPLFVEVAQMGGTNHCFMVQELANGEVVIIDAWQKIHPLRISSSDQRSTICQLLGELLGKDAQKRDMAALKLFGKDHGFKLRGKGIRLKGIMAGKEGGGLQMPNVNAMRRKSMDAPDALILHGSNGKTLELQLDRHHSLDECFQRREVSLKKVDAEGVQGPELQRANGTRQIAIGAAAGAGFAFTFSLVNVLACPRGRTTEQKVEDVLVPTAICGGEGAAVAAAFAKTSATRATAASAGIAVVATGLFVAWDAVKLARGTGTTVQLRQNFAGNAGGAAGGFASGLGSGALAGIWFGPVGVGVAGLVGAIIGGVGGAFAGGAIDRAIWDEDEDRRQDAVEFFGFSYCRGEVPRHIEPETLDEKFRERLSWNEKDQEWKDMCKSKMLLAMTVRWQSAGLILEEMINSAQQMSESDKI